MRLGRARVDSADLSREHLRPSRSRRRAVVLRRCGGGSRCHAGSSGGPSSRFVDRRPGRTSGRRGRRRRGAGSPGGRRQPLRLSYSGGDGAHLLFACCHISPRQSGVGVWCRVVDVCQRQRLGRTQIAGYDQQRRENTGAVGDRQERAGDDDLREHLAFNRQKYSLVITDASPPG